MDKSLDSFADQPMTANEVMQSFSRVHEAIRNDDTAVDGLALGAELLRIQIETLRALKRVEAKVDALEMAVHGATTEVWERAPIEAVHNLDG